MILAPLLPMVFAIGAGTTLDIPDAFVRTPIFVRVDGKAWFGTTPSGGFILNGSETLKGKLIAVASDGTHYTRQGNEVYRNGSLLVKLPDGFDFVFSGNGVDGRGIEPWGTRGIQESLSYANPTVRMIWTTPSGDLRFWGLAMRKPYYFDGKSVTKIALPVDKDPKWGDPIPFYAIAARGSFDPSQGKSAILLLSGDNKWVVLTSSGIVGRGVSKSPYPGEVMVSGADVRWMTAEGVFGPQKTLYKATRSLDPRGIIGVLKGSPEAVVDWDGKVHEDLDIVFNPKGTVANWIISGIKANRKRAALTRLGICDFPDESTSQTGQALFTAQGKPIIVVSGYRSSTVMYLDNAPLVDAFSIEGGRIVSSSYFYLNPSSTRAVAMCTVRDERGSEKRWLTAFDANTLKWSKIVELSQNPDDLKWLTDDSLGYSLHDHPAKLLRWHHITLPK